MRRGLVASLSDFPLSETDKALSCSQASALLSSAKSEIIEIWEARCRQEVPAAKDVPRLALVNSVPDFLEQLAKTLSSPESYAQAESNAEIACLHGEERAKLGHYTLDEVIREYQLLREVVVRRLEADRPMATSTQEMLHSFIDRGIRKAAARYSQLGREELRLVNDHLKSRNAELNIVNSELEQFAYVASHDLQEPLRLVSLYLDLLSKRHGEKLDEEAQGFVQIAVKSARRMKALIEDVLSFSRTGREDLKFAPTDCQLLVDKTIESLQPLLQETDTKITRDPLPTINANEVLIGQVFQNLINNAVKFRGAKAPRIHISAQERKTDWEFSIKDNGIGIEKEYADRIFLIFQRLHGPEKYPGTGIGLALCKRIIERYKGRIWVESEPGEGSCFFFKIPKSTNGKGIAT